MSVKILQNQWKAIVNLICKFGYFDHGRQKQPKLGVHINITTENGSVKICNIKLKQ